LLRADVTPPITPRRGTQPAVPDAATGAALTRCEATASATAIAAVPIRTAPSPIAGTPRAGDHVPIRTFGGPFGRADATARAEQHVVAPA
jgi:hypothetical protein